MSLKKIRMIQKIKKRLEGFFERNFVGSYLKELKEDDLLILLDAGHGGKVNGKYVTAGKRSPIWGDGTQYFEGVGNRGIRDEIAESLDLLGVKYLYVNKGNSDLSLTKRVRFVNKVTRIHKKTLLISIHSNGFKKPQAHGWECFTTRKNTESDKYAEVLYDKMRAEFPNEVFRTDYTDGDQDKEANFKIIRQTICPAILSENFFHTNPRECKSILMSKEGRTKIARAHVELIKHFL